MARQLRGAKPSTQTSGTVKRESKPVPEKKPKEPKQKGGLFSRLKSNKKKTTSESYDYDEYENEEDDVVQPPQQTASRKLKGSQGSTSKQPQEQPTNRPQRQATKRATKEELEARMKASPHGKPTPKTIERAYSQKKLQQNVFMYMAPNFFNAAQKYYNDNFENVRVVGTNSLDLLCEEFQTKTLCNTILLFVFSPNEVKPLHHFLSSIGFKNLDTRILTVYMVIREGIDVDEILDDPVLSDFIYASEYIKIDKQHQLTQVTLDKAISGIIQNQPVYTDEKVKEFAPKKVVHKEPSLASLYKVDIDKLREHVEAVKKELYNSKEKAKIINTISSSKTAEIMQAINETPHLQIINEVANSLDEHLETLQKSPHLKGEVRELLENKFLLETYKAKEAEAIVDEIITRVESKLDVYDKQLASINKEMFKELDDIKADANTLKLKRKEVVDELNRRYAEYTALTGLVANGYTIQSRFIAEACNEICNMVNKNENLLTPDTINVIGTQARRMKLEVQDLKKLKDSAADRLAVAINMSNDLIKHYQLALAYDNLLIDKLSDIIKAQDETIASQQARIERDTLFRNVGVAFMNQQGSGLDTILNLILGSKDLVVCIGDKEQSISDNAISIQDFLNPAWEPAAKQVIEIPGKEMNRQWESMKNIERVVNKLNYVAKYFNNIYIIYNTQVHESTIDNALFLHLVNEIGLIVYCIRPELAYATTVNMLHQSLLGEIDENNLYRVSVFYNQVPKGFNENLKPQLQSAIGYPMRAITVPYRNDIASGTLSNSMLANLRTLKQVVK